MGSPEDRDKHKRRLENKFRDKYYKPKDRAIEEYKRPRKIDPKQIEEIDYEF